MLPFFTLGMGNSIDTTSHGVTLRLVVGSWFVFCLVIGATWQLLYRRDLADRLLLLTVVFVLWMAITLLLGSFDVDQHASVFSALTLPSILAGVILTEHRLRNRDL